MKKIALLIMFLTFPVVSQASTNVQQLLQLVDYIGVDYREAIKDGQVINAGEYGEMQDFSLAILEQVRNLPDSEKQAEFTLSAEKLEKLVTAKADPDKISSLSATLRAGLIETYNVAVIPRHVPDMKQAAIFYAKPVAVVMAMKGWATAHWLKDWSRHLLISLTMIAIGKELYSACITPLRKG